MKLYIYVSVCFSLISCFGGGNPTEPQPDLGALAFRTADAPDDVARIEGRLSRSGFNDVTFQVVIQNGQGSAIVEELEEGTWNLTAEAFDADSTKTYEGSTPVTVVAGTETDVHLVLEPVDRQTTGSIKISLMFGLRLNQLTTSVSGVSAKLDWSTNIPSFASIFYKQVTDSAYTELIDSTFSKTHQYTLSGLEEISQYQVYVRAISGSQEKTSAVQTFTTEALPKGTLLISEYIEGSSNNKAIELYNASGADIDLSEYVVGLFSNGSATVGNTYNAPSGTILPAGQTYVIANSSAESALLSKAQVTSNITYFNGDDALAIITKASLDSGNYVFVDIFGKIGEDPGTNWGGVTSEKTLRRKSLVTGGVTVNPSAFDPLQEYDVFDRNVFDGLGTR